VAQTITADMYRSGGATAGNNPGVRNCIPVPFDTTQITSKANRSAPKPGDACHPLAAGAHAPAIAFSCKDHGADANTDTAPTLRAMSHDGSHANAGGQVAVATPYTLAIRGRGDGHQLEYRQDGTANAILTPNGGRAGIGVGAVADGWAVRRLTPRECERLQGFPDGYTAVPYRGKPAADGPRYKALGNSMAVNCMRWLGMRIAMVNRLVAELERQVA
jgi:DNA (cytosine-5)-methyltransferase 1